MYPMVLNMLSFLPFLLIMSIFLPVISSLNDPKFERPHRGCYFTNWSQYRRGKAKFTAANIDPELCTYIVVAFAKIENDTLMALEWNDEDTFKQLVRLKNHSPNLKILLSVGGWTLSNQLVTVSASRESRKNFAASTVRNLRYWELDGLDIDWEYPDMVLKSQYSALLMELREAFEEETRKSNKPRLALAAAVHFTSDGGYDGRIMNLALDIVNVMCYDLHGAWITDKAGHHAPLFKGPFGIESTQSVAATVKSWEHLGIDKSKLVVGLPLYGRGWLINSTSEHGLGAAAMGPIYTSNFTGENGAWPYYEICERFRLDDANYVFDKDIQAAYLFTRNYWIGYDDRMTVAAKTKWAMSSGYGGVYAWDLAQDDFQNNCGLGKSPLLNVVRELLAEPGASRYSRKPTLTVSPTVAPPLPRTTIKKNLVLWEAQTIRIDPVWTENRVSAFNPANSMKNPPPKPSYGKQTCDKMFCTRVGPGSFSIGKCETKYCDCDAGNNPYSRECIGGLVFDTTTKYCNWQESVDGCTRFKGNATEIEEVAAAQKFRPMFSATL